MKRLSILLLTAGVTLAVLASCASAPPVIPEDATSAELIQRAQEASDKSDWSTAILYYETARERFGTDPAVLVACEYETAFIHYKQGRYALAEEGFKALIAKYETPEGALLSPSYLLLARKVLPKVQEKLGEEKKTEQPAAETVPAETPSEEAATEG